MLNSRVSKVFLVWFVAFHIIFLYVLIAHGDMILGITQNSDYEQWQSHIQDRTESDDKITDIVLALQSISLIINFIFAVLLYKANKQQDSIRKLALVAAICVGINWIANAAVDKFMMWEYLPVLLIPSLITIWGIVIFVKWNKE